MKTAIFVGFGCALVGVLLFGAIGGGVGYANGVHLGHAIAASEHTADAAGMGALLYLVWGGAPVGGIGFLVGVVVGGIAVAVHRGRAARRRS
jgi:hypothetical protein